MPPAILLVSMLLTLVCGGDSLAAPAPDGTPEARALTALAPMEAKSTGRGLLYLTVANHTNGLVEMKLPAGVVAEATDGSRIISLRAADVKLAPGEESAIEIPSVAMTHTHAGEMRVFRITEIRDERLKSFLNYAANRDDLPRATAQLVVFALLEDITFQRWSQIAAIYSTPPGDAPDTIVQAIDALAILRTVAPDRQFALAGDNELKMRALRNPKTRPKALQLYGMHIPADGADIAPGVAPDIGQLLHTKAGDNCPICKMRQQAGKSAGDL
jgi:hypothetical protein